MCVRARERAGGRAQREEASPSQAGLALLSSLVPRGGVAGGWRSLLRGIVLAVRSRYQKKNWLCWGVLVGVERASAAVRAAASCVRACACARLLARAALCVCGSGTSVHGAFVHVVAAAPPPSFFSLPHTDTDWGPRETPRGRARAFEERDRRRKGQKGGGGGGGGAGGARPGGRAPGWRGGGGSGATV